VLPGLLQHYGMVNKNMTMWCEITEVNVDRYWPEENILTIYGNMDIYLYVIGGNVDGTDQLALQFQVPEAYVNGTGDCAPRKKGSKEKVYCYIDVTGIVPGDVNTIYSSFGEVNDLLITRALTMLMQTNANLFAISKA
jgi:hypothetical protein